MSLSTESSKKYKYSPESAHRIAILRRWMGRPELLWVGMICII